MTTTHTPTRTNSVGFPLVDCYRCGGTGHYSYCEKYGSTCFACEGRGAAIRRGKALKAWAAYLDAVREQKETTAQRLQVGVDKVAARRPGDDAPYGHGKRFYATVTAVTVDEAHPTCWSVTRTADGAEVRTVTGYAATVTVTFADGETSTISCSTNSIFNRKPAPVDPAPYLAMI